MIRVSIVYDNNPGKKDYTAAFGFAALVQGFENTVLFDTGGDAHSLGANMGAFNVDPKSVDVVVISHMHGDHYGGLDAVLHEGQAVYLPSSATTRIKSRIEAKGARPIVADKPAQIMKGVQTTGTFAGSIPEQGLVLDTPSGTVLITGCAHPGVDKMTEAVANAGKIPNLVLGGFHLSRASDQTIRQIAASMKKTGVKKAGPCHCSGDRAREIFSEVFEEGYVHLTVGSVLWFEKQ